MNKSIQELKLKSLVSNEPPILTRPISNLFIVLGDVPELATFTIQVQVQNPIYLFSPDSFKWVYETVTVAEISHRQLSKLLNEYHVNINKRKKTKPSLMICDIRKKLEHTTDIPF